MAYYRQVKDWFEERRDYGAILIVPGSAFGDIALVPAPFLKHPKGIREISEWYMSTAMRQDYVREVFERQCEIALANIQTLIDLLGDVVQVALLTGTDFGTQRGLFISRKSYCDLFKPFHTALNKLIHEKSRWKTFIHSCGSVWDLLPDFIDAGFDILNPVQCSAAKMDARDLKREFGDGPGLLGWRRRHAKDLAVRHSRRGLPRSPPTHRDFQRWRRIRLQFDSQRSGQHTAGQRPGNVQGRSRQLWPVSIECRVT